ncbi:MAG: dihydrofolate reductase family protein [Stenomitos frigidus ULC029]
MRRIILFIAASLDGYIARSAGEVNWLFTDQDYGYAEFSASIDTVLMGRKTYEQVLTFGEFPYQEKQSYVFSRDSSFNAAPYAKTVRTEVKAFVEALRQSDGRDIWLVGGAALIQPFIEYELLDELVLSTHPILLGSGIPLFSKTGLTTPLHCIASQCYDSGLVQSKYQVLRR